MKKIILSSVILVFATAVLMSFNVRSYSGDPQDKKGPAIPADVTKILQNSCFDCHSDLSSNQKALGKVNFSSWDTYTDAKKVAKMSDISDEVSKDDMPPAKYLEKFPDRALNADQKKVVLKWTDEETKKLMGN